MKSALLLVLLTLATAAAAPPEAPAPGELRTATVTMPYAEVRALWEAGRRAPESSPAEAAPLPYVVHRAELRIALAEAETKVDATFAVEGLDTKWQRIPLAGGEVRLESVEPAERSIVWDDGYALLHKGAGDAPVVLHLVAPGTRKLAVPLKLRLGSATVKRVSVTGIPAGLEARVNGQPPALVDGQATFLLPGGAGEIALELAPPKPEEQARPLPPLTPSHWQTQAQVLVCPAESRLVFMTRVLAHADDGSGLDLTLDIPAQAVTVQVTGDDLSSWSQNRTEDGGRQLLIHWQTRDVLDRELSVTYSVPQPSLDDHWTLQAPAVAGDQGKRHLYAVLSAEGLELKGEGMRALGDLRRLPEWMRAEIGSAAFVIAEGPSPLVLQTHWLPTIAAAEAIVSEAKASLRLVADGATQTSIAYAIKHQARLAWQLEWPANVELLSCLVNGAPAQPTQRENGIVELSLPAPSAGGTTSVALSYTGKLSPLDPVSGRVALELPRTPLFIEHLDWSVILPSLFEITALDGNVTVGAASAEHAGPEQTLSLRKDLCRAERPAVSLFYQRRTIDK